MIHIISAHHAVGERYEIPPAKHWHSVNTVGLRSNYMRIKYTDMQCQNGWYFGTIVPTKGLH